VTVVATDRIAITPEERRAAIIDVIASARSRLILSLFRCDDFDVLDALVAALARGVQIEALMTDRAKGGRKRLDQITKMLASSGARLSRYSDRVVKYHAKYIAADQRLALVGSANWTPARPLLLHATVPWRRWPQRSSTAIQLP